MKQPISVWVRRRRSGVYSVETAQSIRLAIFKEMALARVSVSIVSRAASALVLGGTTDSSGGSIASKHCLGDLEPVHVGGLGVHFDSFQQSFDCQDPNQTLGDCEFDPNSPLAPPQGNRVQVISKSFLFVDRTTFKWYLSGCQGRRSRWGISLGVGYLNITWNVVNVRPAP